MLAADVVPKKMHIAMIEQKDALIAAERAHKEEFVKEYKSQLDAKDVELTKAIEEKEVATKRVQEAVNTLVSASNRADKLQRERDAIKSKFDAALKGHEQAMRNHGKHGSSQVMSTPSVLSGKRDLAAETAEVIA